MSLKTFSLKKSIWVYHLSAGSCNNCDIEILDCLTPRFDLERFGICLVGSAHHADVILATGIVNRKCLPWVKRIYEQMPEPKLVVAVGTCACSGGIFAKGYNIAGPFDKVIPVSAYIPGCPPKPEAIIDGVVKLIQSLDERLSASGRVIK
ncbi:NADH-quinone oxidoreductase subunit B family protein [Candidatus Aerophobetes bacterium]|nr:NADH-quinone oxidoreductase subunit B family protein [Candidatus Aerophobetes bacterium]